MANQLRLLRAPLWWLSVWGIVLAAWDVLIPNLFILLNYYTSSSHDVYRVARLRPDYLLYLPNAVMWLGYLLTCMLLIELKQRLWPVNRTLREDLLTGVMGLVLAGSSLIFMKNIKPGLLQLVLYTVQVLPLWALMMANGGLFTVNRLLHRPWVGRLWSWTFPVTDVALFVPYRQRFTRTLGWWRLIPTVCYVVGIAALFLVQGRMLWGAIPAELVPVPVTDVNSALLVDGGIWFANGDTWDARAGLWYYDEQAREGVPVVRTADTRRFLLEDGALYYQDRYERAVLKVDTAKRRILWRVPTQPSGTFELTQGDGLVYVIGEGGYILVLDRNGRVHAERQLPVLTFEAQAVWGRRLAFVSGDPRIRIWNHQLTQGRAIPLPLAKGVVLADYNEHNHGGLQIVTSMTAYSEATQVFYAGTFWGDIFRYDMRQERWLPSFRAAPGLRSLTTDDQNRLFFIANYFQGYIDVRDRDTGRHLAYVLANGLTRYIDLDPVSMRGALSTHGYGLYQFAYDSIVRRRAIQLVAGSS